MNDTERYSNITHVIKKAIEDGEFLKELEKDLSSALKKADIKLKDSDYQKLTIMLGESNNICGDEILYLINWLTTGTTFTNDTLLKKFPVWGSKQDK